MLEADQDRGVRLIEAIGADFAHEASFVDAAPEENLCDTLLASFVHMASKSKRRQADLTAALRRANLRPTVEEVRDALRQLEAAGCIRQIVPLYDGGMLVTVTNLGMDQTGRNPHWRFLDRLMPLAL